MTTLTDQQRAAVEPNGCSIALSAGAGCGKTRVLTERFLLHLAPGAAHLGIHRLAAVTFTERAAREMRDRIRQRCHERLLACPESEVRHWQGVLQGLQTARISTIHAFCAQLLRSHAVQAGLDPRFTVADESTAGALVHRVVEDALFDRLAGGDADAEELVLRHGVGRVQGWLSSLAAECDRRTLERWQAADAAELAEHWRKRWEDDGVRREVERLVGAAETQALLAVLGRTRSTDALMEQRRAWLSEHVPTLAACPSPVDRLREVEQHARVRGGGGASAWPTPEVYQQVKHGLAALRDQARRLWNVSSGGATATAEAAAQGLMLLRLTTHVVDAYDRAKRDAALVDFRDLLVAARALLAEHPAVRAELSRALRLILVDEFQDTDPIQVEIVRLLCGEDLAREKLFIVGDANQAIYRFRGADPGLFAQLREELPAEGRKSITKNFRSQPAVLRFVNRLFSETFGAGYEPLVAQTPQSTAVPNVEFLWTKIEPTSDAKQHQRRFEAGSIARRIREMLEAGAPLVVDRSEGAGGESPRLRAPQSGDVALLFRALSDVRYYEDALRHEGLDYYLVGGYGFFAQQEIWDLLNCLRAIEDASDAVSLAGALRSPFFSLRDETLYWLSDGRGELDRGLHDPARWVHLEEPQRRRVAFAAEVLDELRSIKDRLPLAELLATLVERTGYDAVLLAEFLGPRKLANLRKIQGHARRFDAAGLFTLADFIAHLDDSVARQPREEQAVTHPEKSNVIRLMTIHQAKGLEFPIVFVPDLARKDQYGPRGAVLHPEIGPLVPLRRGESHLGLELYKVLEREEEQREDQRLFYVACTRAADYLVLSSSVVDFERPDSLWMRLLVERFDLVSGRALGTAIDEAADARVLLVDGADDAAKARADVGAIGARLPNWSEVVAKVREAAASGAEGVPAAAEPIGTALERRRQFGPSELAAASRQRREREELPLFRFARWDVQAGVDEILIAEGEPGEEAPAAWSSSPRPSGAALVGSAVHAALRCIDFEAVRADGAAERLSGLVAQCAAEVDPLGKRVDLRQVTGLIERFLGSPLATVLEKAQVCHRELEFLLRWMPDGRKKGDDSPPRYLRGFLDCVYQDHRSGWHVVDYKTDDVDAREVPERAEQYRLQLAIYALAACRMLGGALESAQLYFVRPGVAWDMELTAGWEDRTVRAILAAMDELIGSPGGA